MNSEVKPLKKNADEVITSSGRYKMLCASEKRARRRLLIATTALGGTGLVAASIPFVESMTPSARVRAEGGPTEVDITSFRLGELNTVVWRGMPVWLFRRNSQMLESIQKDRDMLADPNSVQSKQPVACGNSYRSLQPDLAVIVGVCTHLGCSPVMRDITAAGTGSLGNNWPGGFFCPCHGSKFDFAGRVFKNVPAPVNLVIPPYAYLSRTVIRIGDESA